MPGATAANDFLKFPPFSGTGLLQASIEGQRPHTPQDGEAMSDVARKTIWVRQSGKWQEIQVGLPQGEDGIIPVGYKGGTLDRRYSGTGGAIGASGTMFMVAAFMRLGEVITTLGPVFSTGGTLTHTWLALYNDSRQLLAVTDDKLTTPMTAGGITSFTLTAPYTTVKRGLHYIGIVQVGSVISTMRGTGPSNVLALTGPILAGSSSTGLTVPGDAPSTAAVITTAAVFPLVYWG